MFAPQRWHWGAMAGFVDGGRVQSTWLYGTIDSLYVVTCMPPPTDFSGGRVGGG